MASDRITTETRRDGAPNPKGIRLHTINIGISIAAILLIFIFLFTTNLTRRAYASLENSLKIFAAAELAVDGFKHASDNMTTQTRIFVVTEEPIYMTKYFLELDSKRRENSLRTIENDLSKTEAYQFLREAMDTSHELEKIELYAIELIMDACEISMRGGSSYLEGVKLSPEDRAMTPEKKIKRAVEMTHDANYQSYSEQIDKKTELCLRSLNKERQEIQEDNYRNLNFLLRLQLILAFLLLAISVAVVLSVSVLIIDPIRSIVTRITRFQPLPMTGAYELRYLAQAYNIMYYENQKNSAHWRHEAEHDPLTGLYNRGAFDKLREEFREKPIALMLIDVDLFKEVNDTWGHDTGDKVLRKVALLLDQNFRFTDYPCRIGGDEFAVIMTDASSNMKDLVRQKLRRISEGLRNTTDGLPAVTLSIGAAFSDRQNGTDDIFKDADRALYAVKTHGRDACEFYGESYMKL